MVGGLVVAAPVRRLPRHPVPPRWMARACDCQLGRPPGRDVRCLLGGHASGGCMRGAYY